MVIVLIRTRLRNDADVAAYEQLNARMEALVQDIPGFVSAKGYRSDDGDEISIVRFESTDALRRWRDLPEHAVAQRRGREEFFAAYDVEVCEVARAYDFHR
jgi:heme-degrading monooxygenase HmoA